MKIFFLHNWGRSFNIWCQIETALNISKILKWWNFRTGLNYFVGSATGSWAPYQKSQEHAIHFELLIDVLAKKIDGVMAISKFDLFFNLVTQFFTYFFVQVTCRNQWPSTYVDQVWWWYVKAFMSYAWQNGQINRQTEGQTDRQTDKRTHLPKL